MAVVKMNESNEYHIIGDIHGHGTELENLLLKLGYKMTETGYSHPEATAIFVGDFIDRGEDLVEHGKVLDIVMPMVKHGHARAVMGNHEFNALAFHTEHPGEPNCYLRPHTEKNRAQHQAFLNEFPLGKAKTEAVLEFFMTLPLFLELKTAVSNKPFRVVHACWDPEQISFIKQSLQNNKLTREFLVKACDSSSKEHFAIERILKGVEVKLPEGLYFNDKDGHTRNAVRVTWWSDSDSKLNDISRQRDLDLSHIDMDLTQQVPFYGLDEPLCVIGHYWMQGKPKPMSDNVICVDFSVVSGNGLTACCLDSELNVEFVTT